MNLAFRIEGEIDNESLNSWLYFDFIPYEEFILVGAKEATANFDDDSYSLVPKETEIIFQYREGNGWRPCGRGKFQRFGLLEFVTVFRNNPAILIKCGAEPGDEISIWLQRPGDIEPRRFEDIRGPLHWTQAGDVFILSRLERIREVENLNVVAEDFGSDSRAETAAPEEEGS